MKQYDEYTVARKAVLAQRLKEARGDTPLYQIQKKSGITYTCLWKYERGETFPTIPNLIRVARALGVKPGWLLGDDLFGEDGVPISTGKKRQTHAEQR